MPQERHSKEAVTQTVVNQLREQRLTLRAKSAEFLKIAFRFPVTTVREADWDL